MGTGIKGLAGDKVESARFFSTQILDNCAQKEYNSVYTVACGRINEKVVFILANTIKVTAEGLKKLQDELEELKTKGRADIAEKIKIARGYGDLSENSEYDEAKNEQAKIEARIVELDAMIKHAEIISDVKGAAKTVSLGVSVKVHDIEFDEDLEYRIVGSTEADPRNGKISDESPVGRALIGKKVGDEVTVEAPAGEMKLKILKISK